jgi:hypothetical protein
VDPHKALLERMVNIILKVQWEIREFSDMGGWVTACPFCEAWQHARFDHDLSWGVNHYDLGPEHFAIQEELENPDNHDPDCLWRLAKEYRS